MNVVTNNGGALCLSMGKDQRAVTHSTADHRWQASDVKIIQGKVDNSNGKGGQKKIPQKMEYRIRTSIKGEREKDSPKARTEIRKITRSKAEIPMDQDGQNLLENQVERSEKAKESLGIKMILR